MLVRMAIHLDFQSADEQLPRVICPMRQRTGAKQIPTKPLLKWPGGKRWLSPLLVPVLRRELKRLYIEPFFGGGAAFAALKPKRALLSDINEDLIRALKTIRTDHNRVARAVHRFSNTEECYYEVRRSQPRTKIGDAARFLYLNRTSWGGIQRFNQEGIFNVP